MENLSLAYDLDDFDVDAVFSKLSEKDALYTGIIDTLITTSKDYKEYREYQEDSLLFKEESEYDKFIKKYCSSFNEGRSIAVCYIDNIIHKRSPFLLWCLGYIKGYNNPNAVFNKEFITNLLENDDITVTGDMIFSGWSTAFYRDGLIRGLLKKCKKNGIYEKMKEYDNNKLCNSSVSDRWIFGFLKGITVDIKDIKDVFEDYICKRWDKIINDNICSYYEDDDESKFFFEIDECVLGFKQGIQLRPMQFIRHKDKVEVMVLDESIYSDEDSCILSFPICILSYQQGYIAGYCNWKKKEDKFKDFYEKGYTFGVKDRNSNSLPELKQEYLYFISGFYSGKLLKNNDTEEITNKTLAPFIKGYQHSKVYAQFIGREDALISANAEYDENKNDPEYREPQWTYFPERYIHPALQRIYNESFSSAYQEKMEEHFPSSVGYEWTEEDSFDALTDGQYGTYYDWRGNLDYLQDMMGL